MRLLGYLYGKRLVSKVALASRKEGAGEGECPNRETISSRLFFLLTPPLKMEQTECSETLAYKIQMPGNHPKERIQHSEHSESLKSRLYSISFVVLAEVTVLHHSLV